LGTRSFGGSEGCCCCGIKVGSSVREAKGRKPSAKREGSRERSDCRLLPEKMGSKEEPSPEYIIIT